MAGRGNPDRRDTHLTVAAYLAGAPEPQRSTLLHLRNNIRRLLPKSVEELAYGVPAFKVDGKAVAGYAYFKNHCSYFPHSGSVLETLASELTGYTWSKGALKFPIDQSLPEELVEHLVAARLGELESR